MKIRFHFRYYYYCCCAITFYGAAIIQNARTFVMCYISYLRVDVIDSFLCIHTVYTSFFFPSHRTVTQFLEFKCTPSFRDMALMHLLHWPPLLLLHDKFKKKTVQSKFEAMLRRYYYCYCICPRYWITFAWMNALPYWFNNFTSLAFNECYRILCETIIYVHPTESVYIFFC